jgi:hypothetical protein
LAFDEAPQRTDGSRAKLFDAETDSSECAYLHALAFTLKLGFLFVF